MVNIMMFIKNKTIEHQLTEILTITLSSVYYVDYFDTEASQAKIFCQPVEI